LATADTRWTEFVTSCPAAGPFHHPAWTAALAHCYRFGSFALVRFGRQGTVTAGLPVIEARSPLGRPRWISLPFSDACVPLVAPGEDLTGEELDAVRRDHDVKRLEIHHPIAFNGAHAARPSLWHTLDLQSDIKALLASLQGRARSGVRQAEREGVHVRWATDRDSMLGTFYGLHVRTRRRLGVPVQPRRLFEQIWQHMVQPGLASVAVAHAQKTPIAASLFLHWNGTCIYKYSASDERTWKLRPNNAVLWHAIRWAAEHGYHTFDLGLTDVADEGLRAFKRGFASSERAASWAVFADRPPSASATDIGGTLRPVLQRLPLWATRAAGALFYRYAA
jgi:CelD/BcsL family acetyltransferase involved in cellulose biosynthesis